MEPPTTTKSSQTLPKPQGFIEDIVAAILNPGYIGGASILVINVALIAVGLLIAIQILSDPRGLSQLENKIHLFALIPLIGLFISINWYAIVAKNLPTVSQKNEDIKDEESDEEKEEEKVQKQQNKENLENKKTK